MIEIAEKGTYCVVIEKQLVTASCPLLRGTCMWKHRIHGGCTYDEKFGTYNEKTKGYEFTPNEFAIHVGLPPISEPLVNILKRVVIARIKKELES